MLALLPTLSATPVSAQPKTFAPLIKRLRHKVVHIAVKEVDSETREEGLHPYFSPRPQEGLGSGFVVDKDGLILTNNHVVSGGGAVEVVLQDGRAFPAEVVGTDELTDLALLRISARGLAQVDFGDSSKVEVGDWVVAIGNPLGLDYSVTAGIISAKGRNIFEGENLAYGEFLQTDAAINPGNSGGPLFDLNGRVIGVNTAISSRGYGIGFAVPSNMVVEVLRQLRQHGHMVRGWIGVVIQELTPRLAEELGLPALRAGILVDDVVPDGPAEKAGIQPGDVLTRFDGTPLTRVAQLQKLVAFASPGKNISGSGLRRAEDGKTWRKLSFTLRVERNPEETAQAASSALENLGMAILDGGSRKGQVMKLPGEKPLIVATVRPDSPAHQAGVMRGDVILEVNRQPVESLGMLEELLGKARPRRFSVLVRREGNLLFLSFAGQ